MAAPCDDLTRLRFKRHWAVTLIGFLARLDTRGSVKKCWVWRGARNGQGVPHVKWARHDLLARRAAYLLLRGRVRGRVPLYGTCSDPACVNPWHASTERPRCPLRPARGLTAEDVEGIRQARAAGVKVAVLAAAFRVSEATVYRVAPGSRPRSPIAPADLEAIRSARAEGATLHALAQRFGVSPSAIWRATRAASVAPGAEGAVGAAA